MYYLNIRLIECISIVIECSLVPYLRVMRYGGVKVFPLVGVVAELLLGLGRLIGHFVRVLLGLTQAISLA